MSNTGRSYLLGFHVQLWLASSYAGNPGCLTGSAMSFKCDFLEYGVRRPPNKSNPMNMTIASLTYSTNKLRILLKALKWNCCFMCLFCSFNPVHSIGLKTYCWNADSWSTQPSQTGVCVRSARRYCCKHEETCKLLPIVIQDRQWFCVFVELSGFFPLKSPNSLLPEGTKMRRYHVTC